MLETGLELGVVVMGLATVYCSVIAAMEFKRAADTESRDGRRMSWALFAQLLGEGFMGFVTTVFALLALVGVLDGVPELTQTMMRYSMFLATAVTTIHLRNTQLRIKRGKR